MADCRDNPNWARRGLLDEERIDALAANILQHGQQVDILVRDVDGSMVLLDGHRRCRALRKAGQEHVNAIVVDKTYTPEQLQVIQLSLDTHREGLTPMELSDAAAEIKRRTGMAITELAALLNWPQSRASKLLALQKCCPEVRAAVQAKSIDQDKAYSISQEPDPDRQRELLRLASGLDRGQLRRAVHRAERPAEPRASVARFPLPAGASITVRGQDMTLDGVIDVLQQAVRELRKGQAARWNVDTAMKVMKDRAAAAQQA